MEIGGVERSVELENAEEGNTPMYPRVLPWPAVSTTALIALSARWAFLRGEQGCLKGETEKQRAIQLLESLLDLASHGGEASIVVCLHQPGLDSCGRAIGGMPVQLPMFDSQLDLGPLQEYLARRAVVPLGARNWLHAMNKEFKGLGPQSLMQVCQFFSRFQKFRPFYTQILAGLRCRLHCATQDLLAGSSQCQRWVMQKTNSDEASRHQQDRDIALYWQGVRDHMQATDYTLMSFTTDR